MATDFIYLLWASDDCFTMTSRTLKLSFLIRVCWYAMTHHTALKSRGYILFLSRPKFVKLLCSSVVETIATFENNWIPWIPGLMISILTTFCLLGYWTCGQMTARSSSVIELVSFPKGETRRYVTMISHGKHFLNDAKAISNLKASAIDTFEIEFFFDAERGVRILASNCINFLEKQRSCHEDTP